MRPPRPKRRHPQPPHAHVRRGQVPRRPPRQARRRRRTKVRRPARGLHITTARGSVSVSWRLVVFVTVVMLIVPSVLIPLTDYVQQREQVRALQAEVAEVKESIAGYEREKARWNNEAYVVSQARDRLGWVLPGETPYIVIDPHTVTGEDPAGRSAGKLPDVSPPPWYIQVVDSLDVAKRAELQEGQ